MSFKVPHGPQQVPLDDLFEQMIALWEADGLRVVRIDQYADGQGGSSYKVELYEVPARAAATGPTNTPGPSGPTGPVGRLVGRRGYITGSVPADGVVKHLGVTDQVITGFRDFDLVSLHDGFILTSRNNAYWRPRRKMVAYCTHKGLAADHDAPGENCDCGIYAFAAPDHPDLVAQNKIWGEIAMWGEVLICETGYRAEYAYPTNLFMRDTGTKGVRYVAAELEQQYGVPVFLVPERTGKTAAEIMMEMLDNPDLFRFDMEIATELDQATIDKLLRPNGD